MENLHFDVVVIGAGCAGMAAGLQAAQLGLSVGIFEKMPKIGGSSDGGNGLFAVGTKMQRDRQVALTPELAFKFFMDFCHWKSDAQLISAYVRKSASTFEWLQSLGIDFIDVVSYFPGAYQTWHFKNPETKSITDTMLEKVRDLGGRVFVSAPAKRLLIDDGRVTGLVVTDSQGAEVSISAKSVIIASGGFSGNAEWMEKYLGHKLWVDSFPFDLPAMVGDGIRMAWEAGASSTPMMVDTYVCLPPPFHGPGGTTFELGSFRQPNLMVNLNGERFMNEEAMQNPGYAANAVHRQRAGCGFMIFDSATHEYYEKNEWDFVMSKLPVTKPVNFEKIIASAKESGYEHLFMADSVEELAQMTGINLKSLEDTLASYNKACETGRDEIFFKNHKYLRPVNGPRFYAAKFYIGGYGSLGGIKINCHAEVIDKSDFPIRGLYAAGNDANALFGDTYPFALSGNASSFCFNTGRIAAESAAEFIGSNNS